MSCFSLRSHWVNSHVWSPVQHTWLGRSHYMRDPVSTLKIKYHLWGILYFITGNPWLGMEHLYVDVCLCNLLGMFPESDSQTTGEHCWIMRKEHQELSIFMLKCRRKCLNELYYNTVLHFLYISVLVSGSAYESYIIIAWAFQQQDQWWGGKKNIRGRNPVSCLVKYCLSSLYAPVTRRALMICWFFVSVLNLQQACLPSDYY